MLLTYSANFVLWKFSAMRQSESYISHDAGMHTQLVAILKGIDTRVDLTLLPLIPSVPHRRIAVRASIAQSASTETCNCNDYCELLDSVMIPNTLSACSVGI